MKDWLIDNLDWNDLNTKAKEGVEGIHCTYFFELYNKKGLMSDYHEYCWKVKQAHFSKDDFYFSCYDFSHKLLEWKLIVKGMR